MGKVLIIKTGHSETFREFSDSKICSLGDVLRTTFILNYFKNEDVTWVTDAVAIDLLRSTGIRVLEWKKFNLRNVEDYSRVINLEKKKELLDMNLEGVSSKTLDLVKVLSKDKGTYQEKLCSLLGFKWAGEDYVFKESNSLGRGIGLNWKVGSKFPEKKMSKAFWKNLESELANDYVMSWQKGFGDLSHYIEWIESVETLVTLDSLGLHIALALKKNVIAMFSHTSCSEIELYSRGVSLKTINLQDREIIDKIKASLLKIKENRMVTKEG
ncbi:glycosyltransferase family 9 protein [Bacteriovoracaceae bacterium]|nr:glycosyltransferase family 9 protein [Bacteriovoracaceae bacterium]